MANLPIIFIFIFFVLNFFSLHFKYKNQLPVCVAVQFCFTSFLQLFFKGYSTML